MSTSSCLLSPLQSDWFFSDDEDKGERVSEERVGRVWSEMTLVLGEDLQQDSNGCSGGEMA